MRRITKAALGGLAGCALVLGGTMGAGASTTYRYVDKLGDFSAAEGPFDSTTGKVTIVENDNGSTTFSIKITGIDTSVDGDQFGAHLHTGLCVDGDYGDPLATPAVIPGSQAGPHYNTHLYPAGPFMKYADIPVTMRTEKNEVWFNLVPSKEDGAASFSATVEFVPVDVDGFMSIVVHERASDGAGVAGDRLACFPLEVPTHWKYQPAPAG